jgi:hypothetical protein
MLHTVTALERMSLQAIDGSVGTVKDTYFDGDAWELRYFVADAGNWLPGRSLLVSPRAVAAIDWPRFTLALNLTRRQIASNRGIADDGSAQRRHLQSTGIVTGYSIEATDGAIGYVEDFLYDERNWALRFVAVDARSWFPGRHLLVAVEWVDHASWNECKFRLKLRKEEIREAPEWYPELALAPQDENSIYRYGAQSPGRQPPLGGSMR